MAANDLFIKAKAMCGTVERQWFGVFRATRHFWEPSGLVIECLTRDLGAAVWSLKGITALCP